MIYVNSTFKETMLDHSFQTFRGVLHILAVKNERPLLDMRELIEFYTKLIELRFVPLLYDFPVKCAFRDALGQKICGNGKEDEDEDDENFTFSERVNGLMSLGDLQEMMLKRLSTVDVEGDPLTQQNIKQFVHSSSSFVFVEIEDKYRIERVQIMNDETPTPLAGAHDNGVAPNNTAAAERHHRLQDTTNYYHHPQNRQKNKNKNENKKKKTMLGDSAKSEQSITSTTKPTTVAEFFLEGFLQQHIFLNQVEKFRVVNNKRDANSYYQDITHGVRSYELRLYPEVDDTHQVYCVWHGEIAQNPWRIEHLAKNLRPPGLVAIPNDYDVHKMLPLIQQIYGLKDEELNHDVEQRQVWLYLHWVLHFPEWKNKMKDFFFFNRSRRTTRPKAIVVHHHCEQQQQADDQGEAK